MRTAAIFVLATASVLAALGPAAALEGGLGFQPTPFLPDYNQPIRAMPYGAVCLAPPASCPVHYEYPIRAGKPCWCRDGLFVYSTGVTQPQHPTGPVYKD